ncbi:MAG: class B sortase [Lachnospiraceae bacterium]
MKNKIIVYYVIGSLLIIGALAILGKNYGLFEKTQEVESVVDIVEIQVDKLVEETEESLESEDVIVFEETDVLVVESNPYQEYFDANEDMVGWLKVDGMNVDYPAMQTMEDENYYLYLNFEEEYDINGCLIVDTESSVDLASTNIIIHGHNMNNGDMFGMIFDYEDESFVEEHKIITFTTETELRQYEVISVFYSKVFYTTDTDFKYYKFFDATTQEEFDNWYDNIMSMSCVDTSVTAEFGDEFITLSTCAYHVENGRFVVVAKRIEDAERYE